jgi:hypothetical protein
LQGVPIRRPRSRNSAPRISDQPGGALRFAPSAIARTGAAGNRTSVAYVDVQQRMEVTACTATEWRRPAGAAAYPAATDPWERERGISHVHAPVGNPFYAALFRTICANSWHGPDIGGTGGGLGRWPLRINSKTILHPGSRHLRWTARRRLCDELYSNGALACDLTRLPCRSKACTHALIFLQLVQELVPRCGARSRPDRAQFFRQVSARGRD